MGAEGRAALLALVGEQLLSAATKLDVDDVLVPYLREQGRLMLTEACVRSDADRREAARLPVPVPAPRRRFAPLASPAVVTVLPLGLVR